uniref:APC membrane recruitment protein 2 n=1 Tax=Amphilophus citrinellus TaxID=61819 RepID=A0A3Q0R0Y6_AMPCI
MDVQTENVDPPPCESQPSGKIRKGFKLFGKRKPGNIFSIRSKGDGNNKSPVHRSKTLDGLSESPAPDSEREPDKEKVHEGSEAEREQAEEEPLGEDGVLAAAPARNSISSASSAKSLSFLSLLRGGRRGVGDRQVHTVSQPVGRQRRGLKGLFGNVKFKSKDKEDKEEVPPSPLLMSSRANSVEIIKEDLTLTPKSQPRSLDSPETESREHVKSLTIQDSAAPSPPEPTTPQATTGSVSKTNENVAPSPTSEPPLIPGDTMSSTSTTTTAPPNTPASVVKAPSVSPILTSTASKLASQTALPPQTTTSVSKPSPVATSPPVSIKPPPVTHSPPIPAAITQPPPAKSDLSSTSCKPSLSSVAGDSKAPATVSPPCTVTAKSSSPDLGVLSKTAVLTSTRDSKIPVKHGAQTHTASQIPQNKEPPRTKIPVSKVPVRRVGNKPAATGGSTQIRK